MCRSASWCSAGASSTLLGRGSGGLECKHFNNSSKQSASGFSASGKSTAHRPLRPSGKSSSAMRCMCLDALARRTQRWTSHVAALVSLTVTMNVKSWNGEPTAIGSPSVQLGPTQQSGFARFGSLSSSMSCVCWRPPAAASTTSRNDCCGSTNAAGCCSKNGGCWRKHAVAPIRHSMPELNNLQFCACPNDTSSTNDS